MESKTLKVNRGALRTRFTREMEEYIESHWSDPRAAWRRKAVGLSGTARPQEAERQYAALDE